MALFGYPETIVEHYGSQVLLSAPDELTIWSANTANLRGMKEGVKSFFQRLLKKEQKKNLELMIKDINENQPDVVYFQENDRGSWRTNGIKQAETIAEETGYNLMAAPVHMVPGLLIMGNAILTKHPIKEIGRWDYKTFGLKIIHEYKDLMGAAICFDEGEVALYNTHFLAWDMIYGLGSSWLRKKEAETVVSVLAQEERPFIFGGDLNEEHFPSKPQSATGVLRESKLFTDGSFKKNVDSGATWPNIENYHSKKERLDYILPGRDLHLDDLCTIDNEVSDHLFVEGKVSGIKDALDARAQQTLETSAYTELEYH